MLLTIHNFPPGTRYSDIKLLLQNACNLTEGFVLDNLISEGIHKKVTIGLADEEDVSLVTRKLNGYHYNGEWLLVKDLRKNKQKSQPQQSDAPYSLGRPPMDQYLGKSNIPDNMAKNMEPPYQAPSSKMTTGNNMPVNQPMNQMNPSMMSYYSMAAQTPYYAMPQTSYMGYGSQQQPNMYQGNPVQYPNQGYSQAPLGFRPEGTFNSERWSQNQQNNQRNDSPQDNSGSRQNKRSLDDCSGGNYSEYDKRSRWEDTTRGRSPPRGRAHSDDRDWQNRARDDNRSRSTNPNDYESSNDYRKGFNNQNAGKGFTNRPNDKAYNSGWSNESRWGYDRSADNNRDSGTSYDKRDNFYRNRSNRIDYEQSNERSQKYDHVNASARNRNQIESSKISVESAKSFNKYHWPPIKVGDMPASSLNFQGSKNKKMSYNEDPYSNYKARMLEKASSLQAQKKDSKMGGKSKKKGPVTGKKTSSSYVTTYRKVPGWCGQAAAAVVKHICEKLDIEGQNCTELMKKNLRAAVRKRMESIVRGNESGFQEVVLKYRSKFPSSDDSVLFQCILKDVNSRESAQALEEQIIRRKERKLEKERERKLEKEKEKDSLTPGPAAKPVVKPDSIKNALRPNPPVSSNPMEPPKFVRGRLQSIPGIEEKWVEGEYDPNYVPEPILNLGIKMAKPKTKKALRKSKRLAKKAYSCMKRMEMMQDQNLPCIPKYQNGNKELHKEVKKQQKKDLAGETEFNLPPHFAKVLEEELDKVVQIMKNAKLTAENLKVAKYGRVYDLIAKSTIPEEVKKALKIQLSKRILKLGPIYVRVFGTPKLPKRARLADYLHSYDLISLKSSTRYPMYIAECRSYECAEQMMEEVSNAVVDGMTLQLKPFQLVEPPAKMKHDDIQKFRQELIRKQVDCTRINILVPNDGKPYEYSNKIVPNPSRKKEAAATAYFADYVGDDYIDFENTASYPVDEDNFILKMEDNPKEAKQDLEVTVNSAQPATVKNENDDDKGEKTNVKPDSDTQQEKKPSNDDKNQESNVAEKQKPSINVNSTITNIDDSKENVSDKPKDNVEESFGDDIEYADDIGEVDDNYANEDDELGDFPDVDLDELDEDDLEDY